MRNTVSKEPELRLWNGSIPIGLRIRRPARAVPKGAIFYLPGRWHNASDWKPHDPLVDIRHYLCAHGYAVASINYRSHFLGSSAEERAFLARSSVEDYLDDIEIALSAAGGRLGCGRMYLMGFSIGAALAFLTVGRQGSALDRFLGVIALDGGLKKPTRSGTHQLGLEWDRATQSKAGCDSVYLSRNPAWETETRAALGAAIASDSGMNKLRAIMPGMEGLGDDGLRHLLSQDEWWSKRMIIELESAADYDIHPTLKFDGFLGNVDCPILALCSVEREDARHRAIETASLTSSRSIRVERLQGWSHLQVLCGTSAIDRVHAPVLDWLRQMDELRARCDQSSREYPRKSNASE